MKTESHVLAIDPGLRACGCAFFLDGKLRQAALVRNTEKKLRGPVAHHKMAIAVGHWLFDFRRTTDIHLVLEFPRIYPKAAQQKGDPNDLLDLAGVDGALTSWLIPKTIDTYFPSDWKGQVPKEIMNKRVFNKLSDDEKQSLAHLDHNTLDAVGIGLKFLGRL